ncbi:hydroxycarboxylic acid receptor 2 [Thunnus maccoyii]|uniref:hydroxycarboxylic acid receptor 2 n=1 Tax=Thunnus maccoyii TaxID=8240 RepID=UPI001C4B319C|nr:hydroxycarboxylic acid receptor 2 [Thunnus maccoyii]
MASAGIPEVMNETTFFHCKPNQYGTSTALIFMIIEMIVGLPGNIAAMWIFYFHMKFWKPHTLYLFNLVLADFLLLISVPFRIDTHLNGDNWMFGQVWCRINLFMLSVNRSASIAFMTTVALDRYFKVIHPHHSISRMTLTQAGKIAGLIWILVIALRIPLLTINLLHQHDNLALCRSFSSYEVPPLVIKVHYVAYIAEFFLPWFMLLFCSVRITSYLRQRQMNQQKSMWRAILAIGVISLVFTICFLPAIVTGLGGIYIKTFYPEDCTSYTRITQLFMVSISFTYLNSALDPVIYCFSSSMYRDALRSSMSHLCFVKKNVRPTSSVANNC